MDTKTNTKTTLTHAELAMLDAMITAARAKGKLPEDHLDDDDDWIKTAVVAMMKTGGRIIMSDEDRESLAKIGELGAKLKFKPTLRQLTELRAEALSPKK